MDIFKFNNYSFSYDDKQDILSNINTSIVKDSITAIIGANGAGKSTFLLCLNGINKANKGSLEFKGDVVKYDRNSIIALRKKVGVVFQNPDDQLFLDNGIKDISFGLKNIKVPEDKIDFLLKEVIDSLELSNFIERPIHTLSFGQKKKIALAGVLVMKPEVLILDEPTAGLDPKGITDLFNLVYKLKKERNLTIIISTHDMDLVALHCEHSILINSGKIAFCGRTSDLIIQPQLLRDNHLRLPRIAHLMEILDEKDGLNVNRDVSTIKQARKEIKRLIGDYHE